ncbi:hypothetical protein CHUAL_010233 [Chamberlinius hualienensis]
MLSVERANSLSESELSDTESARINMSHSSPEDGSIDQPSDNLDKLKKPFNNVKEEMDANKDDESSSDSSECPDYVTPCSPKGLDVKKAERTRLGLMSNSTNLARISDESDEQYAKRVRKHNYLTLAQEFAARQRVESENPSVGDMCQVKIVTNSSEDSNNQHTKNFKNSPKRCVPPANASSWRLASLEGVSSGRELCNHLPLNNGMLSSNQNAISRYHQRSLLEYDASCRNNRKQHRSHQRQHQYKSTKNEPKTPMKSNNMEKLTNVVNNCTIDDLPANVIKMANYVPPVNERRQKLEGEIRDPDKEEDTSVEASLDVPTTFDVYNIETTLPTIDWVAMEKRLARAAREDGLYRHKHRNNREEIRRKLAMGSDNEDYYGGERGPRKPSLQSRLQVWHGPSGMNLQICFMNETANDNEALTGVSTESSVTGGTFHSTEFVAMKNKDGSLSNITAMVSDSTGATDQEPTNFISKQARLQAEARVALAQAKEMARMQMEVEKQRKKKSPIAEIVGIPFPDGKYKLSRHALSEMNLAQLQVIANDLHSQIENLNEELVRLLLERDDLHMEQDSMLVDIEDLTRYL